MRFPRYLMVAALCAACASAKTENSEPPTPVKEVVTGGARIRGGGFRMDVQVGRPFTQKPMRTGSVTANPNAAVTP